MLWKEWIAILLLGRRAVSRWKNLPVMTEGELYWQVRLAERADLLAMLRQRMVNTQAVVNRTPETDEFFALYRDRGRQLAIVIDDIGWGRHEGSAAVAESLKA